MNSSKHSIVPNHEIIQHEQSVREVRQLINSFYHVIDTSARMFEAQYNDLVEQSNFTKEIATILSVSEEEAYTQIKSVTQSWSIFWWLVTAILNNNFNKEISWQQIINDNHLRAIIQSEKNSQTDIQEKLDESYTSLHNFLQKWTDAQQAMIIGMLWTLKETCLKIINTWKEEWRKATSNTNQFIVDNNTHEMIVDYWNKIHEYYEIELWKYNLLPDQLSEVFCACMYNTYFCDTTLYNQVMEKYNSSIIKELERIVSRRNEYEDILWDEDWYDNIIWNIGMMSYNMNIVSYAIAEIIVEKIDSLLSEHKVAIMSWTEQSIESKIDIIAELLSSIENQNTAPTKDQYILLRSLIYQSYEMSDYHFTQLVQYLYSKHLHPTKPMLKHNMTNFLHSELGKYGINLPREIVLNEQWDMEF